mmetsp:Transcript_41680/g.129717  ORF Transcript_41680/g.129717 Transcript_41680/m.129717 type:complete len:104 (-) Transcript_41680:136-447(-)
MGLGTSCGARVCTPSQTTFRGWSGKPTRGRGCKEDRNRRGEHNLFSCKECYIDECGKNGIDARNLHWHLGCHTQGRCQPGVVRLTTEATMGASSEQNITVLRC